MKVLDADSGIVFSSSSTCMKESDNQKKEEEEETDGRGWRHMQTTGTGEGIFLRRLCFLLFTVAWVCDWVELSRRERGGERERELRLPVSTLVPTWLHPPPPPRYVHIHFFFPSSSSGPPLSSQAKSSSPLGEGKRRTELNRRQQRGL